MPEKKPNSYFLQRLHDLGITSEINTFEVTEIVGGYDEKKKAKTFENKHIRTVFETDSNDNIRINYFTLSGQHYTYRPDDSTTSRKLFRTRLKTPTEFTNDEGVKTTMKYAQAKGSGHCPFFTPGIIKKYLAKEEIETLFITEGEFKAFKGDMMEIDIIGLPSIHGFYSSDVSGKLHEDIQELLISCKVKKVVYLTDADTLTVTWAEGKNLRNRPTSFYTAVKNFRNSLQLLIDSDETSLDLVYFMHIRTQFIRGGKKEEAKGLDDLLCKYTAVTKKIITDLHQFDFAKDYFSGKNITSNRFTVDLLKYFGLGSVEIFYTTFRDFIGTREFRWGKSRYQWDGEDVVHVRHEDADQYFRVGQDWYKKIQAPNKDGEMEEEIIPFKIGEIQRDYKKFPDFIDQLARYDAFCNVPNWSDLYRRKHGKCFNVCNPITHIPTAGSITQTIGYLKHLFGGEGWVREYYDQDAKVYRQMESCAYGDPFTVALDYLSIQFQRPKHKLPVPLLVSPEQGTGKSTFLKWLREIYGSNATILNNDQFKMNFNSHYITKYIIGVDEGFLDLEKKAEKERLKQMATADEIFMERKGVDLKKTPYYGKLILCSNDADKVMAMDTEDRRWFVVRVPKLKRKNPFLENLLKEEIPAWLHFILHRKIVHPKQDDLWFKTEYIITDQFRRIVEVTKSRLDKVVENFLKDMFLTYRWPVLRLDLKHLLAQLNDPKVAKYKIDEKDLVYYMEERKKMKREKVQRFKIPHGHDPELNLVKHHSDVGRPFVFRYEDWLNAGEVEEFDSPTDFKGMTIPDRKEEQLSLEGEKKDEDLPF